MAEGTTAVRERKAPAPPRSPRAASGDVGSAASPIRDSARPSPTALRLRGDGGAPPAVRLPASAPSPVYVPRAGTPLPSQVGAAVSASLGVDLAPIQVHTDAAAQAAAAALGTRAFSVANHIVLGSGQSATDLPLIAHEVAHIVQQEAGPTVMLWSAGSGDRLEREAHAAASAVGQAQPFTVTERTGGPRVQGDTGLLSYVGGLVEQGVEFTESVGWSLIDRYMPELRPIIQMGIFEWIKRKVTAALQGLYDAFMAPVRSVSSFIESLSAHFTDLVAWMREAGAKIARGDCSSIAEAADRIQNVVNGLAAPVIEKVKSFAHTVGGFFTDLWDRFGAPAWDFLKRIGGEAWEGVQKLAGWLWDKAKPIRDFYSSAWTWIKNKLGVGEGPEGQDGLLQWVQRKAGEAWDWVKKKLEPYKKQLMIVGAVLVALSPAGPILAVGAVAVGLVAGAVWLSRHMGKAGGVVAARAQLKDVIIPGIRRATGAVSALLAKAAKFISEKLHAAVDGLSGALGVLADSALSFALAAAQWLLSKFQALAAWAVEKVSALADLVQTGLDRLDAFLQPVYRVLGRIGDVLENALNVVSMVAEKAWNAIPACIRDPIVNFLVEHLLKKIPIVAALLDIPDVWKRLNATVRSVIRKLFHGLDLLGAAREIFTLLLDVLKVPVDLVKSVYKKAGAAINTIYDKPIEFLRNLVRGIKDGFAGFFENFKTHLRDGFFGWVTGEMPQGVKFPTDFSAGAIFGFVVGILGITIEKIWSIIQKRVSPAVYNAMRAAGRALSAAWDWLSTAVSEGVEGLWKKLTAKLEELKGMFIDAAIDWVVENIITRVTLRLLTMLDPTGVMAVVNSILAAYAAIETAVEYARRILEMIDGYLDMVLGIAAGVIPPAAKKLEGLLASGIPVAIGFLAKYIHASKFGQKIKETMTKVHKWIDEKLEWLVDVAVKTGGTVASAVQGLFGGPAGGKPPAAAGAPATEEMNFDAADEHHRIWVVGTGAAAEVMVASDPVKKYAEQLSNFDLRTEKDLPDKGDKEKAGKLVSTGRLTITLWHKAPIENRHALFARLKDIAQALYLLLGHPDAPESVVDLTGGPNMVIADPLTRKAGDIKGDEDTSQLVSSSRKERLNAALKRAGKPEIWRGLHVLSARLHGPNDRRNLVLGTAQANRLMEEGPEQAAKKVLAENQGRNVLTYIVSVTPHAPPDRYAAAEIRVRVTKLDRGKRVWVWNGAPIASAAPGAGLETLSINDLGFGRGVMESVTVVSEGVARSIVDLKATYGQFRGRNHFAAVVDAATIKLRASKETIKGEVDAAVDGGTLTFR